MNNNVSAHGRLTFGRLALLFVALLVIVLLGVGSWFTWRYVEQQRYEVSAPPADVVQITITRAGAPGELMDQEVAEVLEEAVGQVAGVRHVFARSEEGMTVLTVYLRPGTNVDIATQDIRNVVNAAYGRLPADIDPPVVSRRNGGDFPTLWLAVSSETRSVAELSEYSERELKPQLASVGGVGGVRFAGVRPRVINVWLDPSKLRAFDLTCGEVHDAIRKQQVALPEGAIRIRALDPWSVEELRKVRLVERGGQPVLLGDVAVIEDGAAERSEVARWNQLPVVAVALTTTPDAGPEVATAVRAELKRLEQKAPEGVTLSLAANITPSARTFDRRKPRAFSRPDAETVLLDVTLPTGASLERTDEVLVRLGGEVLALPGVVGVFSLGAGPGGTAANEGRLIIQLSPQVQRGEDFNAVCARLRWLFDDYPEAQLRLVDPAALDQAPVHRHPITLQMQGPDRASLDTLASVLLHSLRDDRVLLDLHCTASASTLHMSIRPDREKSAALGIPVDRVAEEVALARGQRRITGSLDRTRRYEIRIIVPGPEGFRDDLFAKVLLRAADGKLVPLGAVATTEVASGGGPVERYKRQRTVTITANLAPGADLVAARQRCLAAAAAVLPSNSPGAEYRVLLWSEDPTAEPVTIP